MVWKDILVHIEAEPARDSGTLRRSYAISLASLVGAQLTGAVFALRPGIPPMVMGEVPTSLLESQREVNEKAARESADAFSRAAEAAGVACGARVIDASEAAAPQVFADHARTVDLTVVGQADRDFLGSLDEDLIEAALFDSGRPVLIVPFIGHDEARFASVVVAWNGNREAARAVHDAMPLLAKADNVEVVIVGDVAPASQGGEPGGDLAWHLARHDLKVTVKRLSDANIEVADALLSHIADTGADFLVMGGYGRSRLREFVLGGATRGILDQMTVPVLMSH